MIFNENKDKIIIQLKIELKITLFTILCILFN